MIVVMTQCLGRVVALCIALSRRQKMKGMNVAIIISSIALKRLLYCTVVFDTWLSLAIKNLQTEAT